MTLDAYRRTNGKCRGQLLISINDSLDKVMSGCVNWLAIVAEEFG